MTENQKLKNSWVVVDGQVLRDSEVLANLPKNINPEDSAKIVDEYAEKWIKQKLLLNKAENNIGDLQEINRLVYNYREQLIIENYLKLLVEHKADINPTEEQITEFYEKNKEQYILNENILKGVFIILPLYAPKKNILESLLKEDNIDKTLIEAYCLQNAAKVDFFTEKWIPFRLIKQHMPEIEISDKDVLTNIFFETKDTLFNYIIKIEDYKLEKQISPKSFVQEEIENYLLNVNKIDYLRKMEKDLYDEALRKNRINFTNK